MSLIFKFIKKRYFMKKFSFIVLFLLCNFFAFAQPTTITYQGKLLDNSDMPVNEPAVAFTFAIYDAESGGNKIWPPNNAASTKSVDIVNGLYSVILGTGSGNDEAIEPNIFNGITPYLEVGVNATTLPRTRITSVPFSILSNNLSSSAWASPGAIGSATPNSGTFTALTVGTTTNTYTFPSEDGNGGQVLTTDGSGGTTWATPNQGTVTSVTGTAPISSTGGATPAISISAATTSAAGSMSATDKTKLDGIATSANNYVHPTGDGNLHVPATGTTNSGKVLTAGATAGSLSWETPASGGSGIPVPSGAVANDLLTFDGTNWIARNIVIQNAGSGQAINNMQPYLVVNFSIALYGIYPSRDFSDPFIGAIVMFGFNFNPRNWAKCDGQLVSISQNTALFSLLGTIYGGDGQTTFALPDLRGRTPIHFGHGPGLSTRTIGETGGTETVTLTVGQLPAHSHTVIYQ
jgi:microcystin-dependent protein